MKYGLSEKQLKEITDILASYEAVEIAILFGSRAIDTYKEASDVDIAIKGENADWSLALTIKDHLEEETYLPFFFDVVAYGCIESEELRRHIDGKGKVLFCRKNGELSVENGGSAWREVVLSEIIDLIGGGTPKTKIKEYWNGNIPWLSVVDFNTGNKFVFDTEKKITQDGLENSSTKLLEAGDIIISARGTVGVVAMLGKQMAFNQSCYGVKAIEGKSTNNYIYYLLKDAVSNFLQIAHGGVFDTITRDTFDEIDITLPPLPEQKAIAEVLSALDDKIDLLHRQNKTLEQMAETLFRQWFVVEAGEDWEETTLGEVIETTSGGTPSRKNMNFYENGVYSWVKSKELTGSFILETEEHISDAALEKSSAKLLPKHSVLIAMYGATVGEYSIISNQMTCNQAICALKPNSNYPYTFLFMFVKVMKEEIINMAVGSAQQNISQILIKSLPIVAPNKKINEFHIKTKNSFEKIENNIKQIRTLQSLRNTLLPKLMSGEIRVKYDDK